MGGSCHSSFHRNMWCYYLSPAMCWFCSRLLIVGLVPRPVPVSYPVDCVKSSMRQEILQSLKGRMTPKDVDNREVVDTERSVMLISITVGSNQEVPDVSKC